MDVLFVNSIGPGFSKKTAEKGLGGSELEIIQIAHALSKKGYKVAVANDIEEVRLEDGVTYVPIKSGVRHLQPSRALYVERCTHIPSEIVLPSRTVIRATDVYFDGYDVHKNLLESGKAALVAVSEWQSVLFSFAKERHVINPMLGPTPETTRQAGKFVYASAPMKGLRPTLDLWCKLKRKHQFLFDATLDVVTPGHFDYYRDQLPPLTASHKRLGVSYVGSPSVEGYRKAIASAEGLFYVNSMPETFCCAAAFAERSGTKTHILCLNGIGAIGEAIKDRRFLTTSPDYFEEQFIKFYRKEWDRMDTDLVDRSPEALVNDWEKVLHLSNSVPEVRSAESTLPQEDLPMNRLPIDGERTLSRLRSMVSSGGSEFGALVSFWNIAIATRAAIIVEIGRFKGASTVAFASALKFLDTEGWQETEAAKQRPDIDYKAFEGHKKRRVISIDPAPQPEAAVAIKEFGLSEYVITADTSSDNVVTTDKCDILLIDGGHTYDQCRRDFERFSHQVRLGGYVIFHDAFGWYEGDVNGSPVKKAVDDLWALHSDNYERILIDTGYASFFLWRKKTSEIAAPKKVPAREDGQPTIGLVMIARDENPIIARAINSVKSWVDAITVVVDSASKDGTEELCKQLGADVYVRPFPGSIAEARNESLYIAEQRTDYLLVLDPDDKYEGVRPDLSDGKDHYLLSIADGGVTYQRSQLFKSHQGFRYVGCEKGCKGAIPHEYLFRPSATQGSITSLVYHRLGPVRGVTSFQDQSSPRDKYLSHAKHLHHHHIDHPEDARTVFYLGQSYRDASEGKDVELMKKSREWYQKRATMGGFPEEAYMAAWEAAKLTQFLGEDPVKAYLDAHNLRPERAEPLVALAEWYRDDKRKQFTLSYIFAKMGADRPRPNEIMWVDESVYKWKALLELGLAQHYTRRKEEAISTYERLLTMVPSDKRQYIKDELERWIRPGII